MLRETLIYEDPTQYTLTHVQRLKEALEFLHDEAYDVVLLDLGLPDSHGLDTLITTREQAPGIPIVILTGFEDEDNAIKAVQEGAQDYLIKGQVDGGVLKRSLRYAIERKRAEEAVREREMEAVELAHVQESRRRIIVAQEQLRKEIAQELHGPVQTLLLVAQQRIQGITKTLSTPAGDLEKELAEVAKLLEDVRDNQVRRISHRLHPSIISLGLLPSLRSLRDHMGRAIPIELEVGPEVSEMEENGASSISGGGAAGPLPGGRGGHSQCSKTL